MRSVWLLAFSLLGCGPADLEADESAAAADVLRERAGETTVWINRALVRGAGANGGTDLVASGRTSRNLTDGSLFVFDDVYGTFVQPSPRRFELRFSTTELTTLLVGVDTFARLHFVPSSSRPASLTARVIAGARLVDFSGSGIYLRQPRVVSVGGRPVLRIEGSSSRGLLSLDVTANGIQIPDAALRSPSELAIDLGIDHVIDLVGAPGRIEIRANSGTGSLLKSARIELVIADLELSDGDPSLVWPPRTCTAQVSSCLAALPAGTIDLSSCGAHLEVQACGGPGAIVDDVALQAALQRADVRVGGMRGDASGLVGADRVESFLDDVRRSIESRLEQTFGRRYASAAERDQALDAEIEAGVDSAYARPLDHVEPFAPLPNDPVRARHVAADALLFYLTTFDAVASEWGRPVEELTRMFRAVHVQSLRNLREASQIALSTPDEDIYAGDWLGALVEVTVRRSTGEVTNFLLEVD